MFQMPLALHTLRTASGRDPPVNIPWRMRSQRPFPLLYRAKTKSFFQGARYNNDERYTVRRYGCNHHNIISDIYIMHTVLYGYVIR